MILVKIVPPRKGYHSAPRRPQDSNLQASYGQRFSRPLLHHPDRRHIKLGFFVLPRISIPCPYRGYLKQYDNNDPKHLRSMSVSPYSEKQSGVFIFSVVAPVLDGYLEILLSNWSEKWVPTPLFPKETELQSAAFADSLFSDRKSSLFVSCGPPNSALTKRKDCSSVLRYEEHTTPQEAHIYLYSAPRNNN